MARLLIIVLAAIAAGTVGQGLLTEDAQTGYSTVGAIVHGCAIKGNISLNTSERIYHVPGQKHYAETIITPAKGERWFCSEEAARAAGWRKSAS